ncbi:hypothetical protein VTH06DRAFT_5941 [Thermothelomyces fergusii]
MDNDNARARLEVPIFGPDDGPLAVSLGASRLELNRAGSYAQGGTTPTVGELSALLASLASGRRGRRRPAIRIMIRPRGPPEPEPEPEPAQQRDPDRDLQEADVDFVYTAAEQAAMAASVRAFAGSGLLSPRHGDGFVFGALRLRAGGGGDGRRRPELDVQCNGDLVRLVKGIEIQGEDGGERDGGGGGRLACVLHRAVDDLLSLEGQGQEDVYEDEDAVGAVMQSVRACGFDGVLTSGGKGAAPGNLEGLKKVIGSDAGAEAKGLEVIVGGGVRRGNLDALIDGLKGGIGDEVLRERVWFHSSCLGADGRLDEQEVKGLAEKLRRSGLVLRG